MCSDESILVILILFKFTLYHRYKNASLLLRNGSLEGMVIRASTSQSEKLGSINLSINSIHYLVYSLLLGCL